jgi:hypothetical protein
LQSFFLLPKKNRTGAWQDLEAILYEWQKEIEDQGSFTSGVLLIEKAQEIWRSLPQYKDNPIPAFSVGWLDKFKAQWGIKQYNHYSEAASIPKEAEIEMAALRTLAGEYPQEDMYNMDESTS